MSIIFEWFVISTINHIPYRAIWEKLPEGFQQFVKLPDVGGQFYKLLKTQGQFSPNLPVIRYVING